jgi:hypothetical protein
MWCSAARRFDPSRHACAVVLLPLSHVDSKTVGKNEEYYKAGHKLLK